MTVSATKLSKPLSLAVSRVNEATLRKIAHEPIRQWCERNIFLGGDHGGQGRFSIDKHLWMDEPLKAAQDNSIREIVILKAVHTGGSTYAQAVLEWYLCNRPMPSMVVMQSGVDAEHCQKNRFIPSFKRNKTLSPILPKNPKDLRKDGFRIGGKNEEDATISFTITGPSVNRIQSRTLGLLILDELWQYGSKGYLEMARKRLSFYEKAEASKLIVVSQGGYQNEDLDTIWNETTMEEFQVPCEKCNQYFMPDIEHCNAGGKRWNDRTLGLKDSKGKYIFSKLEPLITLECPHCKHLHKDTPAVKQLWNSNGKYISMNPTPLKGKRGFRWNAFVYTSWSLIVKEFLVGLQAMRDQLPEKFELFFQQRLARTQDVWEYQVRGKRVRSDVDYDPKLIEPDTYRFFGIDVQQYGMYGSMFSCTKQGKIKLLWAGELLDLQDILDRCKEYSIDHKYVLIDSQFRTREVYTWCLEYGFKPVRGNGKVRSFNDTIITKGREETVTKCWIRRLPDPSTGGPNQHRLQIPFYELALDPLKEIGANLRDDPEGLIALPSSKFDITEWQKQMFSERRLPKKEGDKACKWVKIKWDAHNHYWDTYIYALAGMIIHKDISIKENIILTSTERLEEELKEAA